MITVFFISTTVEFSNSNYASASTVTIFLKIILTAIIVSTAKAQNRDQFGWGIFGFFFTGLALIIIGLLPKLAGDKIDEQATNNHPAEHTITNGYSIGNIEYNIIEKVNIKHVVYGRIISYSISFRDGKKRKFMHWVDQDYYSANIRWEEKRFNSLNECIHAIYGK